MAVPEGIDLDAAMRRVATEAKHDPVPDIIGYQDYVAAWSQLRAGLEERLQADGYLPAAPRIVEIAKTSLASRPITVLQFVDRVF